MTTTHLRFPCSLPLDALGQSTPLAGPSRFAHPSMDISADLDDLMFCLCSSKRVVCINGAGVSTAAQIPDFRGSAGLFSSGPTRKGKESVKDLFHVKSLHSPSLLAAHHALISELASLAYTASPTPYHFLLKELDDAGRLLRVYTQNIDGLEEKTGMWAGLPPKPPSKSKPRKSNSADTLPQDAITTLAAPLLAPRVIPLHGTLSTLNCSLCHLVTPLFPYLPLPSTPITCPECQESSAIRHALCERQRRLGTLRPSVVLYGEEHGQGDLIGGVVERDIRGTGGKLKEGKADFLIVAGTSLAIPGVKRIIKELAKALHQTSKGKAKGRQRKIKTVFVNDEPPKNPAEWIGVFDVWVQADIQEFANMARRTLATSSITSIAVPPASTRKAPVTPRKKREAALPPTPVSLDKKPSSLKAKVTPGKLAKKGRENWLPTPNTTPPSPSRKRAAQVDPPSPSKRPRVGAGYRFLRGLTPSPPTESFAGCNPSSESPP